MIWLKSQCPNGIFFLLLPEETKPRLFRFKSKQAIASVWDEEVEATQALTSA
jgi:hypothetical protein